MLPSNIRGRATPQNSRATRATTRSASASAASLQSPSTSSPKNKPRPVLSSALSSAIPASRFPPHMLASLGGPIPDTPAGRGQKRSSPEDTSLPLATGSGTHAESAESPVAASASAEDTEDGMDEQAALEEARAAIESDDNETVVINPPQQRPSPGPAEDTPYLSSDASELSQEQVDQGWPDRMDL
ncbi:hypothetical protein V8E36_009253 [Tilletia maclaganii]